MQNYQRAYEALQAAIYLEPRCPSFWISTANLYFLVNQYRDSLDALTRAVKLHPFLYEPWYNIGVLVCYASFDSSFSTTYLIRNTV